MIIFLPFYLWSYFSQIMHGSKEEVISPIWDGNFLLNKYLNGPIWIACLPLTLWPSLTTFSFAMFWLHFGFEFDTNVQVFWSILRFSTTVKLSLHLVLGSLRDFYFKTNLPTQIVNTTAGHLPSCCIVVLYISCWKEPLIKHSLQKYLKC